MYLTRKKKDLSKSSVNILIFSISRDFSVEYFGKSNCIHNVLNGEIGGFVEKYKRQLWQQSGNTVQCFQRAEEIMEYSCYRKRREHREKVTVEVATT